MQTRFGILFRQRVCGVCKRYVDSFLFDENPNQGDEDETVASSKLKVFACRHIFHVSCLKSYYMRRHGLTPEGKQEINRLFSANAATTGDKLRCVTCNLKNLEMEEGKEGVKKAGFQAARQIKEQTVSPTTPSDDIKEEEEDDFEGKRIARANGLRS